VREPQVAGDASANPCRFTRPAQRIVPRRGPGQGGPARNPLFPPLPPVRLLLPAWSAPRGIRVAARAIKSAAQPSARLCQEADDARRWENARADCVPAWRVTILLHRQLLVGVDSVIFLARPRPRPRNPLHSHFRGRGRLRERALLFAAGSRHRASTPRSGGRSAATPLPFDMPLRH
jgi:hypothetical protein